MPEPVLYLSLCGTLGGAEKALPERLAALGRIGRGRRALAERRAA